MKNKLLLSTLLCASLVQAYETEYENTLPIQYHQFSFNVHAGIAPTVWTDRSPFYAISNNAVTTFGAASNVVPLFNMPKFNHLFKLPWIVGGHLGYAIFDTTEIYGEFNYRQARQKTLDFCAIVLPSKIDTIAFTVSPCNKYQVFDGYLGVRYYGDLCFSDRASYFVGGKFGLLHRKKVNFRFTTNSVVAPFAAGAFASQTYTLFEAENLPASGISAGINFNAWCGLSVFLSAELVATCGPTNTTPIYFNASTATSIDPNLAPSDFIVGQVGVELFFPITVGLRWYF